MFCRQTLYDSVWQIIFACSQNHMPMDEMNDFYVKINNFNLWYIKKCCRERSSFTFGFQEYRHQDKGRVKRASPTSKSELFLAQKSVLFCYIRHVFTHADSEDTEEITWDCDRPVFTRIQRISSLNITRWLISSRFMSSFKTPGLVQELEVDFVFRNRRSMKMVSFFKLQSIS